MNYLKWYKDNFHKLTASGIALRGGELGTLALEEKNKRPVKILISRLSTYFDVGDSFTHSYLYQLAASLPQVFPDFAFLPSAKDAHLMDEAQVPWLLGNQSKDEAKDFDLLCLSNSIVQELINIPTLLKKSSIPLSRKERLAREELPLVILGGANSPWSQILWHEDSWVDLIFSGEDTAATQRIFKKVAEAKIQGLKKSELIEELRKIKGVFVPGEDQLLTKAPNGQDKIPYFKGVAPYGEDFLSQAHLHISEGCLGFCSFCAENWARKPYCESPVEELLKLALEQKKNLGLSKINLFSFNFNMYSDLEKLLLELLPYFKSVGLKSQRFDMLAEHPELLQIEKLVGKMNLSAGLEGISHNMRAYLNKNLSERNLLRSLSSIFKIKAQELKLFVIATGKETEADLDEFAELLQKIHKERQLAFAHTRLVFSITPLVRFPGTPLEFEACPSLSDMKKAVRKIERVVQNAKFEVRSAMEADEYLFSQILLRGEGKAYTDALLELSEKFSFVYYSEVPAPLVACFVQFLQDKGIVLEELLGEKNLEESLGKNIDLHIKRPFLYQTFEKNKNFEEIGSLEAIKSKSSKSFTPAKFQKLLEDLKLREKRFPFHVEWNESALGLEAEYRGQILASALMKADERLVSLYRNFERTSFTETRLIGDSLIELSFFKEAEDILAKLPSLDLFSYGTLKALHAFELPTYSYIISFEEAPKLDEALKASGLKFTLMKREGKKLYEFSKDALKKDIIKSLSLGEDLELVPGKKFQLESFLRELFPGEKNAHLRAKSRVKFNLP